MMPTWIAAARSYGTRRRMSKIPTRPPIRADQKPVRALPLATWEQCHTGLPSPPPSGDMERHYSLGADEQFARIYFRRVTLVPWLAAWLLAAGWRVQCVLSLVCRFGKLLFHPSTHHQSEHLQRPPLPSSSRRLHRVRQRAHADIEHPRAFALERLVKASSNETRWSIPPCMED